MRCVLCRDTFSSADSRGPACDDEMRETGTSKGITVDYVGRGAYQPLVICPTCDEKFPLTERVW